MVFHWETSKTYIECATTGTPTFGHLLFYFIFCFVDVLVHFFQLISMMFIYLHCKLSS
uniref:Uncharacterized protein n=1 Tax=Anguilla anguilla TaxID=7936 RepID=A0A0E9VPE2_ANGAN